jgi:hypothetical protein
MNLLAFIPVVLVTVQEYACASALGVVRSYAPAAASAPQSRDATKKIWPFDTVIRKVEKELGYSKDEGEKTTHYIPLKNMGTHVEVDVTIGTPVNEDKPQVFSLIADTGSNNVIVPSCVCKQRSMACSSNSACFTGTNVSSSFLLEKGSASDGSLQRTLSFGSGDVDTVVAHDVVKLGHVQHPIKGVLLMVDNQLDFEINGIIGLGVPGSNKAMAEEGKKIQKALAKGDYEAASGPTEEMIRDLLGTGWKGQSADIVNAEISPDGHPEAVVYKRKSRDLLDKILKSRVRNRRKRRKNSDQNATKRAEQNAEMYPGFLEQADVAHFSMCFNDHADGWLGLTREEAPGHHSGNSLLGFGTQHWGVGLSGVSFRPAKTSKSASGNIVGFRMPASAVAAREQTEMVDALGSICKTPEKGQLTACGAIIDSGTTEILAPAEHLDVLLDGICDNWERCSREIAKLTAAQQNAVEAEKKAYGSDVFGIKEVSIQKQDTLKTLLANCESWGYNSKHANGDPFAELPTLVFTLCGRDGKCKDVEIPGHQYILQRDSTEFTGDTEDSADPVTYLSTLMSDPVQGAGFEKHKFMMKALINGASKVCSPAFDAMELNTVKNGPSWILGTALFYEYHVGYGMRDNSISFTSAKERPCTGSDPEVKPQLLQSSSLLPRKIRGPVRRPSFA